MAKQYGRHCVREYHSSLLSLVLIREYAEQIQPDFFKISDNSLSESVSLDYIHDELIYFLAKINHQNLPLPSGPPDTKAIQQSKSIGDLNQLLKLVFLAAMKCSNQARYQKQIEDELAPKFGASFMQVLFDIAEEAKTAGDDLMIETAADEGDALKGVESGPTSVTDTTHTAYATKEASDLEQEEREARLLSEKERVHRENGNLREQLDEMYDRYTKLNQEHDSLQEKFDFTKERLDSVLSGKATENATKALQAKHANDVADLESKVASAEEAIDSLKRANQQLLSKAESVRELQDEFDVMKSKCDDLTRRANAGDKYKQKLEASQRLEKDNLSLKTKIADLQNQIRDSDSDQVSSNDLQRQVAEYGRVLPALELELGEKNEMKRKLELAYNTLEHRFLNLQEHSARQQATIEELQNGVQDTEATSPLTPKNWQINGPSLSTMGTEFVDQEEVLTEGLSEGLAAMNIDDQFQKFETDIRAIISAFQRQAREHSQANGGSSIELEKKLAATIERSRDTARLHIQVIDSLAQPRHVIDNGSPIVRAPKDASVPTPARAPAALSANVKRKSSVKIFQQLSAVDLQNAPSPATLRTSTPQAAAPRGSKFYSMWRKS